MANCQNCGAPLKDDCEYCGTRYVTPISLQECFDIGARDFGPSDTATSIALCGAKNISAVGHLNQALLAEFDRLTAVARNN